MKKGDGADDSLWPSFMPFYTHCLSRKAMIINKQIPDCQTPVRRIRYILPNFHYLRVGAATGRKTGLIITNSMLILPAPKTQ